MGKTSLLHELEQRGFTVIPETIHDPTKGQRDLDGKGLPRDNREHYRDLLFECSLEHFEKVMDDHLGNDPIFFDRGFLDAICYANLTGIQIKSTMKMMAETCRYNDHVFILPPWKEIQQTEGRQKQDWNEAVFTYNKMIQTYRSYQYDLIEVPRVSVSERADFVLDHINKNRSVSVSVLGSII